MTIARATRLLLWFMTLCVVGWSFSFVGRQIVSGQEHGRKITLTLLHWGDKAEDVIVQDLIDQCEADHPDVHIVRSNPGYGEFRPKLTTMMAAGTPPDIFYLPPDILPELATLKLIRPIDDYIDRDTRAGQAQY